MTIIFKLYPNIFYVLSSKKRAHKLFLSAQPEKRNLSHPTDISEIKHPSNKKCSVSVFTGLTFDRRKQKYRKHTNKAAKVRDSPKIKQKKSRKKVSAKVTFLVVSDSFPTFKGKEKILVHKIIQVC